MALEGVIMEEHWRVYGEEDSWSLDVPLVPPPGLQPIPFVVADAGLSQVYADDTSVVTAFTLAYFVEYGTRDSNTGVPKTVTTDTQAAIIMAANVDSVTIGMNSVNGYGVGVFRMLLFS